MKVSVARPALKITMSNTRSATAGDFSWRVIAARLRTSVVKYMHVSGSKPNDDLVKEFASASLSAKTCMAL